ncbi:translation elongation factor Ts [symbiont of Argiope bruennichi]|uniref:translation elongation factor Ts n=1 Tax=symbiont of Argiope bruennichi TaxID=2810479 RepID=UPI003DA461D1
MGVNIELLKKLRTKTNAAIKDCKNALENCENNFEKAVDFLRKKGILKAKIKEDNLTNHGYVYATSNLNEASIALIGTETDFCANNEMIKNLTIKICNFILSKNASNIEELLNLQFNDYNDTLGNYIKEIASKMSENVRLLEFKKLDNLSSYNVGVYNHFDHLASAVCVLEGGNVDLANQIAAQIVAMSPKYISLDDVPKEVYEKEKKILEEELMSSVTAKSKPNHIFLNILTGRLKKNFANETLLAQPFIFKEKLSVEEILNHSKAKVIDFYYISIRN